MNALGEYVNPTQEEPRNQIVYKNEKYKNTVFLKIISTICTQAALCSTIFTSLWFWASLTLTHSFSIGLRSLWRLEWVALVPGEAYLCWFLINIYIWYPRAQGLLEVSHVQSLSPQCGCPKLKSCSLTFATCHAHLFPYFHAILCQIKTTMATKPLQKSGILKNL